MPDSILAQSRARVEERDRADLTFSSGQKASPFRPDRNTAFAVLT